MYNPGFKSLISNEPSSAVLVPIVVPCNVNLKSGGIIQAEFPRIDRSTDMSSDEEQSGYYLIKELRHHFEGGQMVTSLRLIRDSYGLYGSNK